MLDPRKEMLRVSDMHAFYGEAHVLHGVDLQVGKGELVTLLGRNGSGRTTTLKAILGLVSRRTGSVTINGRETVRMPTHRIAHLGVGWCPEERAIFSSLDVRENLMLPPVVRSDGMSVDEIFELFPNLRERLTTSCGTRLSGGEQQMLALARILRTGANLLLLDEITEGLAPVIVQAMGRAIEKLKARGLTIVLVEQNFRFAAPLADRHYIVDHGQVVDEISAKELDSNSEKLGRYLGV